MFNINHHISKWLKILLLAVLVFIVWLIFGCSEVKKDQKAVNRVNANANLQLPVINAYLAAHPIDTTPKVILSAPKIIYVNVPQLIKDTTGRQHIIDSITKVNAKELDCKQAAIDAYDLGYDECEKYYLSHPVKGTCPPDTTKINYLTSEVRRWQDSSHTKDKTISNLAGQNDTNLETIRQDKKDSSKKDWYLIFALVALGLSAFFNVKSIFTKLPKITLPKL